jgi:hypothetical protein
MHCGCASKPRYPERLNPVQVTRKAGILMVIETTAGAQCDLEVVDA